MDGGARRPWRSYARVAALGVIGALAAIALAGPSHARIGPFDTTLVVRPSWSGTTTVRLAPLGSIDVDTHDAPFDVVLRVDELRFDEAERIAQDPSRLTSLESELASDTRDALRVLALRTLAVALLGGALGALTASVRWRRIAAAAAIGALVPLVLGGVAVATFDSDAVARPRYTGLLTVAPTAVGSVESIVTRFGDYRASLAELVVNVVALYRTAQDLPTFRPDDDTIRLLHVSDIHLNPQAFDLIDQLVEQFDVDAVLDTGDITDWGTEPETRLVSRIAQVEVPYMWVRGNHDSQGTQRAVAAQPNAVVLDKSSSTVAGLRLWGVGDPRYTPDKDQPTGHEREREVAEDYAPEVAAMLRSLEAPPDIALVHDARIAADAGGLVPLVLAGHTHVPREARIGTSVLLVEGSTGGAGLRGLQGEEPHPLTCSVLYLDPSSHRLVAYDSITVAGLGRAGARIQRHVLSPPEPSSASADETSLARHGWLVR